MLEELTPFLQKWGYLAVLLGAMIEGESIILTASFLAAMGYFSIVKIMVIAFFGTLFADQGMYFVGRYYGPSLLHRIFHRFPKLEKPIEKALAFLKKWDTLYILSFRFIYGIRIVSPVVIGAMGIPIRRFMILNLVAAFIWTVLSCGIGYLLGDVLGGFFEEFDVYQRYIWGAVFGVIGLIALIIIYRLKRRKK